MKILVVYKIPTQPLDNMPKGWSYTAPQEEKFTKEEILRLVPEYDILLSNFTIPVDKDIIDAGKKLKLISNYGVGYNNIDIKYAREKGIAVTNTPVSVCKPTAELCMALLLGQARRIAYCDRRLRTEHEACWGVMANLGHGLQGKTLGIIGMGSIGKEVARKAEAFDMKIIYTNRNTEVPGYERVTMDELLERADYVSLHTPLNDSSKHLINEEAFNKMKSTAVLINTARGAVVDEKALVRALQSQQIAGAALDVFEHEPHVQEALYTMDNVVMIPHLGTATYEGRVAMTQEAVDNILNFVNGTPTNIVN
ncbi:MAG: NAD(P)-dependent oxidoreductase [Marinifilaceae bacterium]